MPGWTVGRAGWPGTWRGWGGGGGGGRRGVGVARGGAVNLAVGRSRGRGAGRGARVLGFASAGFDASVWELLMALGSGGCLVVARAGEVLPGGGLERLAGRQGVTHA